MALNPQERESIIEEETLRFETRQGLQAKQCSGRHGGGHCRRFGWLWLLAFFALGYAAHGMRDRFCHRSCAWSEGAIPGHCMFSQGMMGDPGKGPAAPAAPDQAPSKP